MSACHLRQSSHFSLVCLLLLVSSVLCAADSKRPPGETRTGLASYYHASLDGKKTASGAPFDNAAMTAAHPTYPMGTLVRVTNLEKGGVVEVRITDRGPTASNLAEGVIIDLSEAAAKKIGMIMDGRSRVRVEVLEWGRKERK